MLKKGVISLITAVIVFGIGLWGYQYWQRSNISSWAYIPENSLLVFESNQVQQAQNKLSPAQIKLTDIPFLEDAQKVLDRLLVIDKDSAIIQRFLHPKTIQYSLHAETKDRLNFLVLIPISNQDTQFIERLTDPSNAAPFRPYSYNYYGEPITEIYASAQKEPVFSYIIVKNYLVFSKSSNLMEDVVRKLNRTLDAASLPQKLGKNIKEEQPKGFFTKLYLNRERFAEIASNVFNGGGKSMASMLKMIFSSKNFAISEIQNNRYIQANTAVKTNDADAFLRLFRTQQPNKIGCSRWIPNNTAVFYRLSFSDSEQLGNDLYSYLSANEPLYADIQTELEQKYRSSPVDAFQFIKNEVVFCQLEANELEPAGNYCIMQVDKKTRLADFLYLEAEKIKLVEKKSLFSDTYLGFNIHELGYGLPSVLFGDLFAGFKKTYYTFTQDDYLLMADSPQVLKNILSSLNNNEFWANSQQHLEVLQQCKLAQFTLIINTHKSWYSLFNHLNPRWQAQFNRFESSVKRTQHIVLQSQVREPYTATQLLFSKHLKAVPDSLAYKLVQQQAVTLGSKIISKPLLYKNASSGTFEILLQTSDNHLNFMDLNGKIIKQIGFDEKILSELQPINYFGNNRLQYGFGTQKRFCVFDRMPQEIEVIQSQVFSDINLSRFHVFNPEKDKIGISDTQGSYYSYDKISRILRLEHHFDDQMHTLFPVQSMVIKGEKFDMSLQENGKLYIVNARGIPLKGKSIDLEGRFASSLFVESNNDTGNYVFVGITKDGKLRRFTLEKNIKDSVLYRPTPDVTFKLLHEQAGKDWLITREAGQTLQILDTRGNELFTMQNIKPNGYKIEYFNVGSGIKIISLREGSKTIFWNIEGKQLTDKPVISDQPVAVLYAESYKKLLIYAVQNNKLAIWGVRL